MVSRAERGRARVSIYQAMDWSSTIPEMRINRVLEGARKGANKKRPQIKTSGSVIGIGHFAASRPVHTNSMRVGLEVILYLQRGLE
jgi:hypothetical protein